MPKKKKPTKEQRREARLRKGAQWLTTYQGTPKHMLKHYRERFHVDAITASKDLQALGVNYTQEQLDTIRRNEEERIRRKHEEKTRKQQQLYDDLYGDTCDDRFAYIAGYTSGGAPYGTTWEEMGIDPSLPFSEKVMILGSGDFEPRDLDEIDWDEEEFDEESPLQLQVIPESISICKVESYSGIDLDQPFVFTGRTDDEKSLVCPTGLVPENTIERADGWRMFRICGELDFSLIGILAELSSLLAEFDIGIFAISTFNTDYVLTKEKDFDKALKLLARAGYEILK